jgi:hypothetical protein
VVSLLTELDAFFTDHHDCGDLDAGVESPVMWIACQCEAMMVRRADEGDHAERLHDHRSAWPADAELAPRYSRARCEEVRNRVLVGLNASRELRDRLRQPSGGLTVPLCQDAVALDGWRRPMNAGS